MYVTEIKEKQAINPSGTLFGADYKVGARTIWKSWCCINSTDHSIDRIILAVRKNKFIIHKMNHKYSLWIYKNIYKSIDTEKKFMYRKNIKTRRN